MGDKVEIVLDNSNGAYFPGQTISGRIQCLFSTERKAKGVKVRFRGRSKTKWKVGYGHKAISHEAKEVYFDQEFNLAGGDGELKLAAGSHNYPFSYTLPQELPSSFEAVFGEVFYTIKAVVGRSWKFDYEDDCVLKIISPLDLNSMPALREPVGISIDKNPTCFLCKAGPITLKVSLPVTGFVPGQNMNVGCYVQNKSRERVEKVVFKIIKHVEFITHIPSTKIKISTAPLVTSREEGVDTHAERTWNPNLQIPTNVIFENLTPCSIINISYRLEAELILPAQYKNPIIEIPICIGTIPLFGLHPNFTGPPPMPINSIGASNGYTDPSAPPSYAEVSMQRDQKDRY